jgi:hypothetical protein
MDRGIRAGPSADGAIEKKLTLIATKTTVALAPCFRSAPAEFKLGIVAFSFGSRSNGSACYAPDDA